MKVSVTYPIPPTLNEQIREAREHWASSANAKTRWTNQISILSRGLPQFSSKVWLEFTWQVKNRASDPDNISAAAKYLMDGLVKAGVLTKDSLMIIQTPVIHQFEKGNQEVIVTLSDRPLYQLVPITDEVAA